jgi:hypothetical protein
MTDQQQLKNVEYFNYFGSMITNYARYIREIYFRIARIKASFNKKTAAFTSKLDLNLSRKIENCNI